MSRVLLLFIFLPSLILHFINLDLIPIFSDEAVFLSQADSIKNLSNLFISLDQDQFPIITWALSFLHYLFPAFNFLILGRSLSVVADLVSTYLVYLIGKKIGGQILGIIASAIYIVLPLNFLHSRMVFLEPLTNVFTLAVVWTIIVICQEKFKWKHIFMLFIFSLLSFFTKPLSITATLPALSIPIVFALKERTIQLDKRKLSDFLLRLSYGLIPALIVIVTILILWPSTQKVFSTHAQTDSGSFQLNIWKTIFWSRAYLTEPILLLASFAALFGILKKNWKIFWLSLWVLFAIILKSGLMKFYYPRHLYFLAAPFSLLSAYGLIFLYDFRKTIGIAAFIFILSFALYKDFIAVFNPKKILVGEEIQEFYEDWSSGVGLKETATKLNFISMESKVELYVENEPIIYWSLTRLYKSENVQIYPNNDLLKNRSEFYKTLKTRNTNNVYLLLNRDLFMPDDWEFRLVHSYPKGANRALKLYKYGK